MNYDKCSGFLCKYCRIKDSVSIQNVIMCKLYFHAVLYDYYLNLFG